MHTRGAISSQLQQAQLRPEVTRWQKANVGTLLTEIKAIWHNQKPNSPTTASPGYPNTPGKQDLDLKSQVMMLMEGFMEGIKNVINNSLKELQKNTSKQSKALQELRGNTTKQVKELNKAIQDLKKEVETIMKSQRETTRNIKNLGKKSGVIDAIINNRIQEIEERISDAEDTIESIDTTENVKFKMLLTQNIQEIQNKMRRPNLRIKGIRE